MPEGVRGLFARPGAVTDPDNPAVIQHFGDPVVEQQQLAAGAAIVHLAGHGVVTVRGADRLSWLTTLSSQVLTGLQPRTQDLGGYGLGHKSDPYAWAREALLLDYNGHIAHRFGVIDDGAVTYLLVEPGCAGRLVEFLEGMVFAARVQVRDESADWCTLGMAADGPLAQELPESWLRWRDPWPGVTPGGTSYSDDAHRLNPVVPMQHVLLPCPATDSAATDSAGDYRRELTAALARVDARLREHPQESSDGYRVTAAGLAGTFAWTALRVANWRPLFTTECDERALPHELDWLRTAVHLEKGCYCGQETVARVVNLGRPPRRLVQLDCDGDSALPQAGDAVFVRRADREKQVGRVTSVARHWQDGVIALAVVSRNLPDGEAVVNDNPVTLTPIVTETGRATASPAQRPGAGLRRLPTRTQHNPQQEPAHD